MENEIYEDNSSESYTNKDPDDILDYSFDWSEWVESNNDSINSYSFIQDGNLTLTNQLLNDNIISVFVAGGVLNSTSYLTCRIVTNAGRRKDKTLFFRFKDD